MTIEEEIFKKANIRFDKLLSYGFKKEKDYYLYFKNILDNSFRVDIEIKNDGSVHGKIYDLAMEEEYTNFRVKKSNASYTAQVREEFQNILIDIRNRCCVLKPFLYEQANRIAEEIKKKYNDKPEFEWTKFPGYAVFKNAKSRKWYGIIMNIDKKKLDNTSSKEVEIIDIKLDPKKVESLQKQKGFYPAYHMNKKSWITILLDDTISDQEIMNLIEESYSYTK